MFKLIGASGHRKASPGRMSPRVQGLAAGRGGPLTPDIHLRRPFEPETLQDNVRDADNTGRVSGLGTKK